MPILDRLKNIFTNKALSTSSGIVNRNYWHEPEFNPTAQVTGITYKAIDKIGQTLSVYEMQVKKRNGDAYVNHPLVTLANNPNPRQNASDFVHLYGMLFEIYGETFWYMAKGENTNRVKEVYLLNPAQVEVVCPNGELLGYILHKASGEQIPLEIDEVYHDKRPDPFNEWRGMSVLEKAAVYVNTEINTAQFTLNYIRNSASPSGIVSLPDMDQETFKQFALKWREGYEGPQNAGKTAFIRGEQAKFQAVGATLKDIDQKVTRDMAKEDVLIMLDVPKEILGFSRDSGFGRSTIEAFDYIFAKNKLEPMMTRLDYIWSKIGESYLREGSVEVTHVSPVPEDKEFELQKLKTGVNIWLTPNEARAEMGLPPLPDGDVLNTANPVPQNQTKSIKVVKKAPEPVKRKAVEENATQEQFRSKLVDTNTVYATKFKRELTQFAETQETQVIDKINASSKAFEEWLFNVKDESEAMATLLLPVIVELMEAQAEDTKNFITGEVFTLTPEMQKNMEVRIKQIAGTYNSETIASLEKTLTEGQAAGESLAKLKKRVEVVYSEAKGYRAERIARTETLKASNLTVEQVYKQNGYSKVEWFTNPGACEFCRTYSGKTKEIGGNFNNVGDVITGDQGGQLRIEYDNIPTPPLHPQCTCSIIPV